MLLSGFLLGTYKKIFRNFIVLNKVFPLIL